MIYRGFPSKLHHDVPPWVDPNSLFHIRIRLDRDKEQTPLTDALLATTLLKSAEFYDSKFRWHIALFLLMPDHVHALLTPAPEISLELALQFIKGGFSYRLKSRPPV